ncbi:hypothetical protein [Yinghuangia sp. YIM S09857]|uniref:hypothetical protein n=1 Tax=Yinghuangia sp. YIM S09857 TaxID=3436929 RepID=UPI003F52A9FF
MPISVDAPCRVVMAKLAVPLKPHREGDHWWWIPPFNGVGVVYTVTPTRDGRNTLAEVIHAPTPEDADAVTVQQLGDAESLPEAARMLATAFQRDYC